MQVFKLYFKVLKRYLGQMIMYVCIFAGVLFGFIIPNNVKNSVEKYEDAKCKYAIFDYDNSEVSEALSAYLENAHKKAEIADDDIETIQDEMYGGNVDCVVIIKEGFGRIFKESLNFEEPDKIREYFDIYAVSGVNSTELFEQSVNAYITTLYTYINAGFELTEAVESTNEAEKVSVNVSLPEGDEVQSTSPFIYMLKYLAWVLVAMCIIGIAPVLCIFDRKEIRDRIGCSSYKFGRINMETLLGILVTGIVICACFLLMALIGMREELLSFKGLLQVCNLLCYMVVALALTFFVSRITSNKNAVSALANVISLGMAFLCGVFVPMELLSGTVIKLAHFLPAYWYVVAVNAINSYSPGDLPEIFSYMGIELLFGAAVIVMAVVIYRNKRVA